MKRIVFLVLVLAGASGFAAGLAVSGRGRSAADTPEQPEAAAPTAGAPAAQRPAATAPGPDFTDVAARTINSVTNISSLQPMRQRTGPFADPFFRYFFGDDPSLWESPRQQSLGSGVIVSRDGYVLTNQHVIRSTRADVTVAFGDKREVRAKIVGADDWTDIALLKVDVGGLEPIPWGDSSKLRIAEWVMAIGNPFQLSQTVTIGVVSAVGRTNLGIVNYEDFIQTDAAINPGNSGGALVNVRGELVGINTAIYSETGGYQGIGFAVPSAIARHVFEELRDHGEVRRGSIGIREIYPVTTEIARELELRDTRGALVLSVIPRSPAAGAGIRRGDVIVEFDGQEVADPSRFLRLLADARIGSTVRVGLIRNGRRLDVNVEVARAGSRRM
jgi:serine protease Do